MSRRPDFTVANLAELATLHVADLAQGANGWVDDQQDYWTLEKASGATPDGITVIAPIAGAPIAGAAGARWLRESSGPSFLLGSIAAIVTAASLALLPGPLPTLPLDTWVNDRGAFYTFVAGSVVVADGYSAIAPTGGVPGRWLLASSEVVIRPLGSAADDGPGLTAAIAALAGKADVRLADGLFTIATPINVLSQSTIRLSANTVMNSTMAPTGGGNQGNTVFTAVDTNQGPRTHATTLNANIIAGSKTLVLTSAAGYAIGQDIVVGGPNGPQAGYTIENLVGPTVTTDRPILKNFPSGTDVHVSPGFVRDVSLIADRGAVIEGTGDHAFHGVMAMRVYIAGLRVVCSFNLTAINLDWATIDSRIENVVIENPGAVATTVGVLIEDAERTSFVNSSVSGLFSACVGFVSTDGCFCEAVTATGASTDGFLIECDTGDTTWGNRDLTLVGCRAIGNGTNGYQMSTSFGSAVGTDVRFVDCEAQYNSVGLRCAYNNTLVQGGFFANNSSNAFWFEAGTTGTKLIGVRTQNNITAFPGDLTVGTIRLDAGVEIHVTELDTNEANCPFFISANGITISIDHWRHASSFAGQQMGMYVNGGIGTIVHANDITFNFSGGGGAKFGFEILTGGTYWLDRLDSIGSLTDIAYFGGAPIVKFGLVGMVSQNGDASGIFNYGAVVAAATGNPQTVPAPCVATDRPPSFTRTATGGTVFNPPVVVMGNGSFAATFSGTDSSTYAWRL